MRFNYIYKYVFLAVLAGFTSCIKDAPAVASDSGDVVFELKMTRSDDPDEDDGYVEKEHEDKIKELHVLFFTNDAQKEFIEIIRAEQYGLNTDGTNPVYMVNVKKGTYHMVLLANCGEYLSFYGLDEVGPEDGLTIEDFRMQLTMHAFNFNSEGKWTTDTDDPDFRYMPMWGEKADVTVDTGGADLRGPEKLVPMLRLMARIDIVLSTEGGYQSVASQYDLYSVRLYNWRTDGQAIPNENAVNFTYSAGVWNYTVDEPSVPTVGTRNTVPLIYSSTTALTEYRASIYTFENEKPDTTDPDMVYEPMEYPCLVIGLTEKGNLPGAVRRADPTYDKHGTFFYRIDFIDNNGNWLDILRNHNYTFTVTKVINEGFPDPDQAHRSWVYDVDFQVEWESGFNGSYASGGGDGIYRLDISQTYLEMTFNSESNVIISSTHPDGWSAYTSQFPDKIEPAEYLELIWSTTPEGAAYPGPGPWYYATDDGAVLSGMPSEDSFILFITTHGSIGGGNVVEEYIHIVSGNLTNVIKVRMRDSGGV